MATRYICDSCGNEEVNQFHLVKVTLPDGEGGHNNDIFYKEKDLCPTCVNLQVENLKGEWK